MFSEANNPNYFSPVFGGVAFTPAAHTFVWALMANHSSENPKGFLEHSVLDKFFSYSVQPDGSRKYEYGKDRIPENWYRRSHKNPWTLLDILAGVASQCLAFPSTCKVGGNTGEVNSFDGVDLGDISGGLVNALEDLQDPARLACFIGQNIQAEAPSSLERIFTGDLLKQAVKLVGPIVDMLGSCPNLPPGKSVNQYGDKYPGAAQHGKGRGFTAKDTKGYPADAP